MVARDPLGDAPVSRRARLLVWILILSLAAVLRLASWDEVFGTGRVAFVADSDPNYHVLRAERMLHEPPLLASADPFMNYPRGAVILWPPLFDGLIALPGWLLGGTCEALERSPWSCLVVGLATLPLGMAAWARSRRGARGWWPRPWWRCSRRTWATPSWGAPTSIVLSC
jgi:hypothetical protein